MIIGGSIGMIGGSIALIGAGALAAMLETTWAGLMFACTLTLISAVVQFIAGITGVKNSARPEKAQLCIVLGILVAALSVAGNIISTALGDSFSVMSLITGLIVPVLYTIGGVLNKKEG